MRVLITGSREWPNPQAVWDVLKDLRSRCESMVLVHGDCRRGVDKFADVWGTRTPGVRVERHPAKWGMYGQGAGLSRNQAMVDRGADLCVAFIYDHSRGATHCADAAQRAGIKTLRHLEFSESPLIKAAQLPIWGEDSAPPP